MVSDNWFLFVLIILIVFAGDGELSNTETLVLTGILAALAISCCRNCPDEDDDEREDRCTCGGRLTR